MTRYNPLPESWLAITFARAYTFTAREAHIVATTYTGDSWAAWGHPWRNDA